MSKDINEKEVQKRHLALVYIMIAVSQNCKAAFGQLRYPTEVWAKLKTMFQAVSEATVDESLMTLQNIRLDKGQ